MSRPVLCTPLRVEQAALRGIGRSMRLVRTGMGPRRATATAAALSSTSDSVLVAGVAGALHPQIRPGDVVVATEVHASTALSPPSSTPDLFARPPAALLSNSAIGELRGVEVPSAPLLAGALRRLGLTVHLGPISSVARIGRVPVHPGSLAVDMESAQLVVPGVPFAVVRAIVDTTDHPLWHVGTVRRGVRALRSLRACRPALEWWAAATGRRELLLAPSIATQADLVLVVGFPHSSGSRRLVELARRAGLPAYPVDDVSEIDLRWLAGTTRVGITADTSASPHLVDQIVHCLGGLGSVSVSVEEGVTVATPGEVG